MNQKIAKFLFFYPVRIVRGEPICKALFETQQFEENKNFKSLQWKLLQETLNNAHKYIPFYKNHPNSHTVSLKQINSREDFSQIPFLTKDVIRENYHYLKNPNVKKFEYRSTSGSTGVPLKLIKDKWATAYMDAVMYHSYSWHGIQIGDKQIRFWGLPRDTKNRSIAKIKDFLMNRIRLSAFGLNQHIFLSFAKRINKETPDYFYGYPSIIYSFAKFLIKEDIHIGKLALKAIICTGEQIFPVQKNTIEKCFGTKVISEYGCTEVGVIGLECPQGNLHEMSSNIYLEIIKNGRPVKDAEGEICVTELHSSTFSFIRYKTGDKGRWLNKSCNCGIPFPIFKISKGRIDALIMTPEGKKVHDAIFAYTMKKGVIAFKAVQIDLKTIIIDLVPDDEFYNKALEKSYYNEFKKTISSNMDYRFNYVKEIKPEKSGKLSYFRSEIKHLCDL